jgi:hypothetical protein
LKSASRFGHLNIIKWFFAGFINKVNGSDIVNGIVLSSILGNHMHILEWISETLIWAPQTEWDRTTNLVARASRNGNLSMVKLLIAKGFEYRHTVFTQAAAASGNLEVLMYLRSLDCPWSETIYLAAAEHGHLEILQWAESHNCPWDNSDLFPAAAKSSNRDVYQWLLDRQCPFKEEVSFHFACDRGNFEFIKFARANGSTLLSVNLLDLVQDCAADRGDLETILWALNQSNPQHISTLHILRAAATHSHMHILEWLETVVPVEEFLVHAIEQASIEGHVDVLKWVVRNGYKWDAKKDYKYCLKAIENSNLQALIWMNSCAPIYTMDLSFPVRVTSMFACQVGDLNILKWLHKNGCPCDNHTYHEALITNKRKIAIWIQQQLFGARRSRINNSLEIWT